MEKDLVSIGEAAEILGVHIDTLRRWDESGRLPAIRKSPGGSRYYHPRDLELFSGNLYRLAYDWISGQSPIEIPSTFYCGNNAVFQTRLIKMQNALGEISEIKDIFPLVVAVAGEIGNNSFDHNLGKWPDVNGIFFAYDVGKREIILADRGLGILETLKRVRPSLSTDEEALKVAFTEVISGRSPESRGNGLKFVRSVVAENLISLSFQSGNSELEIKKSSADLNLKDSKEKIRGCIALIKF
jgi:excisionase family DNA binding protein